MRDDEVGEGEIVSLAVLLDNARAAIIAARDAGIEVRELALSPADFDCVRRTKSYEEHMGLPLRVLGVGVVCDPDVTVGNVRASGK
ncbi:hypothetical protein GQ85_03455 [Rhodococcus rhodochrous]|nr:hypothetical protein GQ85_03455 [Rhodococcus rhodochrous]